MPPIDPTTTLAAPSSLTRRRVRSVIEEWSPVEALTVYRALVVCHMAGAVFALMGLGLNAGAIDARFRSATLVAALVQLVVATWLLRNPEWVPRLLLRWPQTVWSFSLAAAVLYMLPATDPVSPPTVTIAFAWISTAAAVGPPRAWVQLGVAASLLIGFTWMVAGIAVPEKPLWEATLLSVVAMAPGAINGAWMGATGDAVARKIRRWGLVIGHEAGALSELGHDAARVREATDRVLEAASSSPAGSVDEIALRTLRESATSLEYDAPTVVQTLNGLVAGMRTPFAIQVAGTDARIDPQAQRVVNEAVLRHLTNVARHAPAATQVTIEIGVSSPGRVAVVIADDGAGVAPGADGEGEGTSISRSTLAACGGTLRYEQGAAGVILAVEVPAHATAPQAGELGLVRELRHFIDLCLRNNRIVGYVTPVPFLLFGMDAPLWSAPLLLCGGAVIEFAFRSAGPSEASNRGPLVAGAATAVVITLCFALGLDGDQAFVCSSATAYPIIELAWRGHWRLWLGFEVLRGIAILPWLVAAGAGGLSGAFVLPTALTLIAVGARRLVMRATAVEARVGGIVERRRVALDVAQHASLRHDVVNRLVGRDLGPDVSRALDELDTATHRLGARHVQPFRPLEDLLDGVAAACAPVPVLVTGVEAVAPSAEAADLTGSLGLERRLAILELAAAIGEQLVAMAPPRWNGEPRLREVVAEVLDGPGGATRVWLHGVTDRPGHDVDLAAALDGIRALGVRGTRVEPAHGGLTVTIEPTRNLAHA